MTLSVIAIEAMCNETSKSLSLFAHAAIKAESLGVLCGQTTRTSLTIVRYVGLKELA